MKFVESLNSRKLTLTYLSVMAVIGVSVWFINQIESIEDLYGYMDKETLNVQHLIAFQSNFNLTLKDIFGSLMICVAGIIAAYLGANVWQKNRIGEDLPQPTPNTPDEAQIED